MADDEEDGQAFDMEQMRDSDEDPDDTIDLQLLDSKAAICPSDKSQSDQLPTGTDVTLDVTTKEIEDTPGTKEEAMVDESIFGEIAKLEAELAACLKDDDDGETIMREQERKLAAIEE